MPRLWPGHFHLAAEAYLEAAIPLLKLPPMPIRFATSPKFDLKLSRWSGHVDIDDYRAVYAAYLADAGYVPGRRELCDASRMVSFDADFNRIWSILTLLNDAGRGRELRTRCVVLAPGDMPFGMARIFQSLAENAGGVRVDVVRTEAEALAVLDLPGATLDEMEALGRFEPPRPRTG